MFCTKCGKKLFDGDSYCGYCGAKVREELMFKTETKPQPRITAYDEVVFNPPFKAEAQRRTQHIEEETKPYSSEPRKERVTLDWNLDGFPQADRKQDDFEINWDAVIEKKRDHRTVSVEKILPETGFKTEKPEEAAIGFKAEKIEEPAFGFKTEKLEEPVFSFKTDKQEEPVFGFKTEKTEEPKVEPQDEILDLFKEEKEEAPLSIEELEKALFGTEDFAAAAEDDLGMTVEYKTFKEKKKEEEFHTFNSKRDAFQELLDRERARIEALENERKSQWEELTTPDEVKYVPKKALEFEEVFKEPKLPLVPPVKEVAVVLPPLTAGVMADDLENIIEPWYEVVTAPLTARVEPTLEEKNALNALGEAKAELKEDKACPFPGQQPGEQPGEEPGNEPGQQPGDEPGGAEGDNSEVKPEEKTKLRYSDIFPVDAFDTADGNKSGGSSKEEVKFFLDEDEDDDDEDDEKEGNGFIKFLIIVLALIVVIELVLIGAKFVAPQSKVALFADSLMAKVTGLFVDDEPSGEPVVLTEENPVEKYVGQLQATPTNIGKVDSDPTLKYDLSKTYAYAEIAQTSDFIDVAWNGDDSKTNGYLIVEAVLGYYDGWKASHPDSEVVGINQVTVGEVRSGNSGYYVLNKVAYAEESGEATRYESVYLEASGDKIMVKEVKEETI